MKKQKNYLSSNLKHLRERKKKTQTEVANALGVTRAKINAYENSVNTNPTVDDLGKFTAYFKISVDSLLWVNLMKLTELQIRNLEAGNDEYIMGTKIRVLATTVDSSNRENIEIVPIKAKAGYAVGYGNVEFIESLQSFQLPFLSSNKKYRMFQLDGDSMLPIPDRSFVIGEYIENWKEIKNKQACVLLTKEDGVVFKQIIQSEGELLTLRSFNPLYHDYQIEPSEILEIWKFKSYITDQLPESGFSLESIGRMVSDLKTAMTNLPSL